jgi:hypothetical protein
MASKAYTVRYAAVQQVFLYPVSATELIGLTQLYLLAHMAAGNHARAKHAGPKLDVWSRYSSFNDYSILIRWQECGLLCRLLNELRHAFRMHAVWYDGSFKCRLVHRHMMMIDGFQGL